MHVACVEHCGCGSEWADDPETRRKARPCLGLTPFVRVGVRLCAFVRVSAALRRSEGCSVHCSEHNSGYTPKPRQYGAEGLQEASLLPSRSHALPVAGSCRCGGCDGVGGFHRRHRLLPAFRSVFVPTLRSFGSIGAKTAAAGVADTAGVVCLLSSLCVVFCGVSVVVVCVT